MLCEQFHKDFSLTCQLYANVPDTMTGLMLRAVQQQRQYSTKETEDMLLVSTEAPIDVFCRHNMSMTMPVSQNIGHIDLKYM